MSHPTIIQGGMGVAVSNWRLARAVSLTGQLGVVSGTALATVQVRLLQQGDPGGNLRRAFNAFPLPAIAERVWREFYVPGGLPANAPFKLTGLPTLPLSQPFLELTVLANFVEIYLAKEGHSGRVGLNLLEKIQLPTIPSLYGAMLAGVDTVLMGAGIPRSIPGILDGLARGAAVEMKIDVDGAGPDDPIRVLRFDPRALFGGEPPAIHRPEFLAIVSSATLALTLAKKSNGRVDGFVIEGATAGGHNAPPRGPMQLSELGEPIYGPRDVAELPKFRDLGLPFWLAGAFSRPGKIAEAQAHGAVGVQVGTAFALCEESGIFPDLKRRVAELVRAGKARVFTDPLASPTGFPFKVVQLARSMSDAAACATRPRICDLGYLRTLFRRADGTVGYRCASEAVADWVRKGGEEAATLGRKCLCNGLMATAGFGQTRASGETEMPIVTAGDELMHLADYFDFSRESYSAADVIRILLGPVPAAVV